MTIDELFNELNNKHEDYDKNFGPQCKDLFSRVNRDIAGNPNYIYGDAWELYDKAPSEYYEKVTDPKKGDIAVWKKEFGGFGHVAIVWDDGKYFSQNYPRVTKFNSDGSVREKGTPCSIQTISTKSIKGYLRPKKESEESMDKKFRHEFLAETIRKARMVMLTGNLDATGTEADILRVEREIDSGNKYALEQLFKDYEKANNFKCKSSDCSNYIKKINNAKKALA